VTKHRVLHFLWNGDIGGAERAVYQLVRLSAASGEQEVGIAFGRAEGPYAEALQSLGCEVIDLRMRSGADLYRALRATSRLREFDIHHFHVLEPCEMVASTRCRDTTRVFTQRHGVQQGPASVSKRIRRTVAGRLLREDFHAVSGNTQHATSYAVARYGLEHLPHEVTYNGLDFSLLTPSRDRAEVRLEFNAGPTDIVVGSSGNFKTWKRLNRVVELLGAPLGVKVLLVGDGSLRGTLEAKAAALKARDRLHITGLVRDVADYLRAMDIFVLPSTADESFGNSVVEAMALGIPSIVFSDSPGICEHIEDGVTGFIVKDQGALTSVVERLAADAGLRTRVGSAGARYVRSAYTLANMQKTYLQLYEAALARRTSA
jgi:glycosyltransferase involved in cell wall biosynthesis